MYAVSAETPSSSVVKPSSRVRLYISDGIIVTTELTWEPGPDVAVSVT